MPWIHWWIPELIISSLIWWGLAPNVGSAFLKRFAPVKSLDFLCPEGLSSLKFIFGYAIAAIVGSFLVALHAYGIFFLGFFLVSFGFRASPNEGIFKNIPRLDFFDLIAVLPIAIGCYLSPIAIDISTSGIQYAVNHDFWPLDWKARLDVHLALPVLLSYWYNSVPLINALSVQGVFLALLAWRILLVCLELILERPLKHWDKLVLLIIFAGSLYFRRQIYLKASPIGVLFLILAGCLFSRSKNLSGIVGGFLIVMSFYFGEVAALFFIPIVTIMFLSEVLTAENLLSRVLPWAIWLGIPELIRKIYIFSGGHWPLVILGSVGFYLLGWALKISLVWFHKKCERNIRSSFQVPMLALGVCLASALVANFWMPFKDNWLQVEAPGLSYWTLQREGLSFIFCFAFLIWNRKKPFAPWFFSILASPFLWFFIWHFVNVTGFSAKFDPGVIWMNVVKDETMFYFPIVTTLLVTAGIISLGAISFKNMTKINAVSVMILVYFSFFQDPIVKAHGDGPLSPAAPRFSAYRGFYELLWTANHKLHFASDDGNLVLCSLALPYANAVQKIFDLQKKVSHPLNICIDESIRHEGVASSDEIAYTTEYVTGSPTTTRPHLDILSHYDQKPIDQGLIGISVGICDFKFLNVLERDSAENCSKGQLVWSSPSVSLCAPSL